MRSIFDDMIARGAAAGMLWAKEVQSDGRMDCQRFPNEYLEPQETAEAVEVSMSQPLPPEQPVAEPVQQATPAVAQPLPAEVVVPQPAAHTHNGIEATRPAQPAPEQPMPATSLQWVRSPLPPERLQPESESAPQPPPVTVPHSTSENAQEGSSTVLPFVRPESPPKERGRLTRLMYTRQRAAQGVTPHPATPHPASGEDAPTAALRVLPSEVARGGVRSDFAQPRSTPPAPKELEERTRTASVDDPAAPTPPRDLVAQQQSPFHPSATTLGVAASAPMQPFGTPGGAGMLDFPPDYAAMMGAIPNPYQRPDREPGITVAS